jgi:endo-1,4-beta-xylanase
MKNNHFVIRFSALTIAVLAITGCGQKTLRDYADKKGLTYGVSVQAGDVLNPKYVALIKENFNLIVPENTMKWKNIRPTKTFWNWSDMDALVAFAEKNHIRMKGHTFAWHQQNAPYVDSLATREEAIAMLTDQITTIMTRYKGRIAEYDVCNEVLNEDGTMRDTVWMRTIGPDYLKIAFRTAREADPKARLLLNDYNNEYMGTAKGDAFYGLVKELKESGVPIDGVGFQLHVMASNPIDEAALRGNIKRFRELGLSVSFTEVDVRVAVPLTPEKEAEQTASYAKLLEIALDEPNAGSFIMWGYSDKRSWIPGAFPGYGFAHLYDREDKPKPVYGKLKELIAAPKKK